jgi:hypothetical protein
MITVRNNVKLSDTMQAMRHYTGIESLLDGPAETGKTFACCLLMHLDALTYPNMQGSIIRKVRADMAGTVLQTFGRVIKTAVDAGVVKPYGGTKPDLYKYKNGSEVWVVGLDRPGAVLSAERDRAYFCQMEQIPLGAYEYVVSRCTGRAGNTPFGRVIGDSNPDIPNHWIQQRAQSGVLKLFRTTHKDNPTLWDGNDWTERGKRTIEILNRLTGIRRKRLLEGIWCGSEGLVYEGFHDGLVIDSFPLSDDWKRYIAIDWGFRDPMVIQWWANKGEKSIMYREIYKTGLSIETAAITARKLTGNEKVEWGVCDHDPQNLMTFKKHWPEINIYAAQKGRGSVTRGIHEFVEPAIAANSIQFFRDALNQKDVVLATRHEPISTIEEFGAYSYPEDRDGYTRKEEPIDAYNHGMDCIRYYLTALERMKKRSGLEVY